MYKKLEMLLNYAYAPYSKFGVAAITVWENGDEFTGINVENCAYPSGMCAERVSIFNAVSKGYRKLEQVHILVSSEDFATPCGGCRQVIAEFADKDTLIYSYKRGTDEVLIEKFFDKVLPRAFTPKDLLKEEK